jgi:glycosyltransferase involved in cell wall biosynthesis
MSEATPSISVCLLTYNHVAILSDTIQSVLSQTFQDFELILSDDCSSDGTWELLNEFARKDARVRPLRTPRNLGMPGNSNFAVSHARAPYIALLHHDDLYAPNLLAAWYEVAERHPEVGFVSNSYANYQSDVIHGEDFAERNDGVRMLEQRLFARFDSPFRGTALIRRSAWDAVGGMRERFGLIADVDLWMRLARHYAIGYVREPVITVRQRRPEDYPDSYVVWTWPRQRVIYEIHGVNRREYFGGSSLRARLDRQRFRLKVSADIGYWICYALIKRRWEMLASSGEVENEFELPPERWLRRGLAGLAQRRRFRAGTTGPRR